MNTETIRQNGTTFAIIIYAAYNKPGVDFFTPDEFPLQMGYMNRKKGYQVEAHRHHFSSKQINAYQEVLIVKSGKIKIDLYNNEEEFIGFRILQQGDIILLAAGGHGVEILEDAELMEIKQGPFMGDIDKVNIKSVIATPIS